MSYLVLIHCLAEFTVVVIFGIFASAGLVFSLLLRLRKRFRNKLVEKPNF